MKGGSLDMKKLVGLIVCFLVISCFSVGGQRIYTDSIKQTPNVNTLDDDVPSWQVGDEWIYELNNINFEVISPDATISLHAAMKNLILKVSTISGSSYVLEVTGDIKGDFSYDLGNGTRIAGELTKTTISGSIKINIATLSFEEASLVIDTKMILREYPLPINIPIRIPFTITVSVVHDTPRPVIEFPLFDGKSGTITEAYVTISIKVESIILKLINIFVPDIPSEINYETGTFLPSLFYEAIMEQVTVLAGTFSAYHIGFLQGAIGAVYYAPERENIIKIEMNLEIQDELIIGVSGELKNEVTSIKAIV